MASELKVYAYQTQLRGAAPSLPPPDPPISPKFFNKPVAEYLKYSVRQLGVMETHIAQLQIELAGGDRPAAKVAWRTAFADYLTLGAVYLEGRVADLDQAIDGSPGGLRGGTASPQFTGLHRIEFGLWTGAPLAALEPYASRLAQDVAKLRDVLPHVEIDPLDYATRAHEILEDAVRDFLTGTDVPWSGQGVLATQSGLAATEEVIRTLAPVLKFRDRVLPVVERQLAALGSTFSSLRGEHGGTLPDNRQLTPIQAERLSAATGEALEALAQVPGKLETTYPPQIAGIPRSDERFVP